MECLINVLIVFWFHKAMWRSFFCQVGYWVTIVVLFLTYGIMSLIMGGGVFKMKHDASDFTSRRFNNKDNNAIEMRIKQI